jgi:cysteine desulfurase / selenocysteine lyase
MIDASVRNDFPLLDKQKALVYFDNACMTLRPSQVIEAITGYYTDYSACAGRSNHRMANRVHEEVEKARETVRRFIGAKRDKEVVFTRNTTEGINLITRSLDFKEGDVVLISDKEHNSNLVPWLRLKEEKRIELEVVPSLADNQTDITAWEEALKKRQVRLVSFVHTSNLDGVSSQAKEIIGLAHKYGALVMMDGAQAVPHRKISVKDLDVDFMAFSAHKMCGPSGMGVLYGKQELLEKLHPFLTGGDTVSSTTYDSYTMLPLPERFEAGLQDYAGIIGLGAAVAFLEKIGLNEIHEHEIQLNELLTKGLSGIDRVRIIGPEDASLRGGVASFTVKGADHHQIALMLDQMGTIAVRSGQHCVHSWFDSRHISGSVRASLYLYNTSDEVEQFLEVFTKVLRIV